MKISVNRRIFRSFFIKDQRFLGVFVGQYVFLTRTDSVHSCEDTKEDGKRNEEGEVGLFCLIIVISDYFAVFENSLISLNWLK